MRTVSGGATATPSMTPARSGRWNAGPAPSLTSRSSKLRVRDDAYAVAVRAFERELLEALVRVKAAHRRHLVPRAVGTELPRQHVVRHRYVEDLLQLQAQLGIRHRDDRLDAPVEVARHQVRRTEVVLRPSAVAEREDARVLEKLADDRPHANPVRKPGHAGAQRAHAPHEKVDLGARLGRRVKRVDDLLVDQVVDLDDDPAADHRLALDELRDARAQ